MKMSMHTHIELKRRRWLTAALLLPLTGAWAAPTRPSVEVWKDPNCGCCKDWVAHLTTNGFQVKVHDTGNNALRSQLGIAEKYGSCHTALVAGYALEGHVPAGDIKRLLQDRPAGIGLAVPGMPVGSPGMDGPEYGKRKDVYSVLLLKKDGSSTVYKTYEGNKP